MESTGCSKARSRKRANSSRIGFRNLVKILRRKHETDWLKVNPTEDSLPNSSVSSDLAA